MTLYRINTTMNIFQMKFNHKNRIQSKYQINQVKLLKINNKVQNLSLIINANQSIHNNYQAKLIKFKENKIKRLMIQNKKSRIKVFNKKYYLSQIISFFIKINTINFLILTFK